ncbi:MAG: hypothetical protein AAF591_01190 [Verrucomicrobiota bacterium]
MILRITSRVPLILTSLALAITVTTVDRSHAINVLGHPVSNWTEFTAPPNDGSFSLDASPGSITASDTTGSEFITYNPEDYLLDDIGEGFQITGEFNFSSAPDGVTYMSGFASGPQTTFSSHFQRLAITHLPVGPIRYIFRWEYDNTIDSDLEILASSNTGNTGDTILYDISTEYAGTDQWNLVGSITLDGSTVWDSTSTPVSFTNNALLNQVSHFSTGVAGLDGGSVSITDATFVANIPEPTRALLLLGGFTAALLQRRRS